MLLTFVGEEAASLWVPSQKTFGMVGIAQLRCLLRASCNRRWFGATLPSHLTACERDFRILGDFELVLVAIQIKKRHNATPNKTTMIAVSGREDFFRRRARLCERRLPTTALVVDRTGSTGRGGRGTGGGTGGGGGDTGGGEGGAGGGEGETGGGGGETGGGGGETGGAESAILGGGGLGGIAPPASDAAAESSLRNCSSYSARFAGSSRHTRAADNSLRSRWESLERLPDWNLRRWAICRSAALAITSGSDSNGPIPSKR